MYKIGWMELWFPNGLSRYEKLSLCFQNCSLPGAFGELGPRIPCCKKSLGSGFSFTTESWVQVSNFKKEPNNHLPVHVLFSFPTPHPDPSHQHSWIRLKSLKVKVQFKGKETYLGKINFLTSVSIGPMQNVQYLNIDNKINGKAGITTACQHLEPPGLTK